MIGIDTNILVRYLVQDDDRQARIAADILHNHCTAEDPGFITVIAMVELFWTLRSGYKFPRDQIIFTLQGLLRAKELVFQCPDAVRYACNAYTARGADFADALLGALAAAEGCATTLTFDKTAAHLPEFTHADES
jgi:predicted nucleic-acid-binding protein